MQTILITLSFITLLIASGCSAHKLTIQQGNAVTGDKIDMLEVGMEERKVLFILGNPMLKDPFHKDRWDYYYSLKVDGDEITQYRATLYFEGGTLKRIEKSAGIPDTEKDAQKIREVLQK